MQVESALKKILETLRGLVTKRERMVQPISRLDEALRGLVKKREKIMKFFVVISVMMLLCVTSSGLTLIQLSYNNSGDTSDVTDPAQVVPNNPPIDPISSVGSFKTIGIGAYWDENITDRVDTIAWGVLGPGAQSSVTIYLHNESNLPVTLSRSTSNWNPTVASNYLTLSWDYNGQVLEAGENIQVTLTLRISGNVSGVNDFGFDITVLGTERA